MYMKRYNLVDDINVYGLNEIVSLITDFLSSYDDFNLMKNNLKVILNDLKNYIYEIKYDDDNLYVYLNCNGIFCINYDYKNFPLLSFTTNKIMFSLNSTILNCTDDFSLNLNDNELEIKNVVRLE